jgi:MYXO-CTERM domain-containing protein
MKRNAPVLALPVLALPVLLLLLPATAPAKVTLPGGKVIPDPTLSCCSGKPCGLWAVFACACTKPGVCNIGAPCPGGSSSCDPGQNGTCEATIWHSENDNSCIPSNTKGLDPVQDAATKPETFRPVCGLTFSLLTRGNAMFKNGFGWYNVLSGKKPDPGDLHLLVDCNTSIGTKTPFNMLGDPAYKGGDIGFFLVTPEGAQGTCAAGDCCATVARALKGEGHIYYSEAKYNPDNDGSGAFVHLLTYNSKLDSHTFYFAWEDIFKGTVSTDYSDFVTSVSGISCAGAGVTCDTGKPGICGLGVTKCDPDGKLICEGVYSPEPEKCDALDNDCDGQVDNGATCPEGKVCYLGTCVGKCTQSAEFPCHPGFECDESTGLCLDKLCKGVTCKKDEICVKGVCGNGCEGVVCPKHQICMGGACVDPCKGRTCQKGELCKLGVCLPDCTQCGGITCTNGMACDASTGDCYDPSCDPKCKTGTYCESGKCVDFCHGVKCPGGVQCVGGVCPPPGAPGTSSGGDGPLPYDFGTYPGTDGGGAADNSGSTSKGTPFKADDGCSCALGAEGSLLPAIPGVLLLLLLLGLRRRG